jgi:hypothetical protein
MTARLIDTAPHHQGRFIENPNNGRFGEPRSEVGVV